MLGKLKEDNHSFLRKRAFTAIALVLVITFSSLLTVMPATAQTKTKTFAFLNVDPNPVGLGQTLLVNSWTVPQTPMVPGTSIGQVRNGYYYDFTRPDGTTFTEGPHNSDSAGSATDWFTIKPDQVGNWKVKFRWAGDELFLGCESQTVTFTVQSTLTQQYWPETPIQDRYWTRPISAANREWYTIGGAWMQSTGRDTPCFNPYSQAPTSAHVLWKVETGLGGLIGGQYGATAYSSSAPSKVIMYGRAYYSANDGVHCVDVHTGEELWVPAKTLGSGTMFVIPGPTPYIWRIGATKFERFDAFTGLSSKNVTGQPTGTMLSTVQGSTSWRQNRIWMDGNGILYINIDDVLERFVGTLAYDTKVSSTNFYSGVMWHLQRESMNSTNVCLYNYTYGNATAIILKNYTMPLQDLANMAVDVENGLIFHSANGGRYTAAINAKTGELLWNKQQEGYFEGQGAAMNGIGSCGAEDTLKVYGFDLYTGAQIWASEPNNYPWGAFRAYSSGADNTNFYHLSYDGTIRAYDIKTGVTKWVFSSGNDTTPESPYGTWPFYNNPAIAGGVVFATTAEHTPTLPLKRGERLYALNATTGKLLWSIMGCNNQLAIADGVLVASDSYTPLMYGFAKGQTATTVTASSKIATRGSMVLIEGSVMDMSPAQPNTPAISDANMGAWMEYIHMLAPKPTNAVGVKVHLTATDPNGNWQDVGYATSDDLGNYAFSWTPPVPGMYKVRATFEGSNAYYTSEASTSFVIIETPSAVPAATAAPTQAAASPTAVAPTPAVAEPTPSPVVIPPTEAAPTTTYIAIGAAVIIIVAAAAVMILKKRK
jgi:outer membrane protein assembly factor BamB